MTVMEIVPEVIVNDQAAAAAWFCDNLFFKKKDDLLVNGSCMIRLIEGTFENVLISEGEYGAGVAHIALRSNDIIEAQRHCEKMGLDLLLDDGHAYFNPKVYEEGEYYFNIRSPFGLTVEISMRKAEPHYEGEGIIAGLDHIGLPSESIDNQLRILKEQGFVEEFETVHNYNDIEGNILCCMTKRGNTVFEVYQFTDMKAVRNAFPNLRVTQLSFEQ